VVRRQTDADFTDPFQRAALLANRHRAQAAQGDASPARGFIVKGSRKFFKDSSCL